MSQKHLVTALAVILAAVPAMAQITPVSQDRYVDAEAAIDDYYGSGFGDSRREDAPDLNPFDEFYELPIFDQFANATATVSQTSSIEPNSITGTGSAFGDANSFDYMWMAMARAESSLDVVFQLAAASDYTLTGELTASSQGTSSLELRDNTTQALIHDTFGSGQTPFDFSGNLPAGEYRLFVYADAIVQADAFNGDLGAADFDVTFMLQTSTPTPPAANGWLSVGPNPMAESTSIRFATGAQTNADIDIFDARGRLVRRLAIQAVPSGRLLWDGRDDGGRRVPRGVYVVRLNSGTTVLSQKVSILR